MTIDEIVEEFREKFCRVETDCDADGNRSTDFDVFNECEPSKVINWLRKKLTEAEREGQKKAYFDVIEEFPNCDYEIKNYCDKKLKELEAK